MTKIMGIIRILPQTFVINTRRLGGTSPGAVIKKAFSEREGAIINHPIPIAKQERETKHNKRYKSFLFNVNTPF